MADKVGRPTLMTQETINKLEQAFSLGASDLEACFYAGISTQTLYNYQNANPEYIERKAALKERLVLKARTVIKDALEDNDKNTAQWYLERKKKNEFSTRTESTGADGGDLKTSLTVRFVDGNDNPEGV